MDLCGLDRMLPNLNRKEMKDLRIIGLILGGGERSRLQHLTRDRSKPAVTFAGMYRW